MRWEGGEWECEEGFEGDEGVCDGKEMIITY